ncbi:hypothetical protein H310_04449 [Aphanomyces invadans]|uniref:Uncharacterized protein n=1 Tax=Aphanomyces invadans TaxID=157072 RepID=A0A024UDV2_9STRA|nr:hypothetical protein H310_04449 [Aphanomyces invadans]ETW04072.1 hypothetical protein H310_04449 [Aphanomyces invadans]|eukprot:XP_008867028.1 hypothetical protein H310_04449 [Aphanomyces invadans]
MTMQHDVCTWLHFIVRPSFKHIYRTKDLYNTELNQIKEILNSRPTTTTTIRRGPRLFRRHVVPPVPECPKYQTKRIKVSDVRVPFSTAVARRYKLRYSSLPTIPEVP